MAAGDPPTFTRPDGFPYASLRLPPIAEAFEAWSVALLADWCTDNGCGCVIHDRAGEAAWVLTFGNLWSLRAGGTLDASPADDTRTATVLEAAEEVLVGQPNDELLPGWARAVLRRHLQVMGVESPRVALVLRPGQTPERSFAVDLPADPQLAHRLTWCLPPDMGLLGAGSVSAGSLEPL